MFICIICIIKANYLIFFIGNLFKIFDKFRGFVYLAFNLGLLGLHLLNVVLHEGVLLRAELLEDVGEEVLDVFLLMGPGEEGRLFLGGVLVRGLLEVEDSVVVFEDVHFLDVVEFSGL